MRTLTTIRRNLTSGTVAGVAPSKGDPFPPGPAEGFDVEGNAGGGKALRPRFSQSAERVSADVSLPERAMGALRIAEITSGVGASVALMGVRDAVATTSDGYVIYAGAYDAGASVLHRALPIGVEDFIAFAKAPSTSSVEYLLSLDGTAAGLRLVENTLEIVDASGAPRLRVEPPALKSADGTDVDATLAIDGCAVDPDPSGPWGRSVVPPGAPTCTLRVSWPASRVTYPAVLDPRWVTTGSMSTARQGHTATLLANGRVLVAGGGTNSATALASAELFDRATGTWAVTGSMTGARRLHTAVQLLTGSNPGTSGTILVAGGLNGSTSLATAQLYTPSTGTWTAAGNLNAARHGHVSVVLADGRVLIAGGLNGTTTLASAALFDPTSGAGTWSATTGPLPPTGQKAHTATLIKTANMQLNNRVLLLGGNNGSSTVATVYLFDPAQSAFSTLASMPSPREGHTATALPNGNILVAGGRNGTVALSSAVMFNPSSGPGSWSLAGTMTGARQGHTATLLASAVLASGQVLVVGGANSSGTLGTAELFSNTATWTSTTALPAPTQGHTATLLSNGSVLVAGGVNGTTTLSAVRVYDPSLGLACSGAPQCASGFCVSGVCCDTACADQCKSCVLAGTVGTCTPKVNGTACNDGSACTGSDTCQSGTCTGANPTICTALDQCHVVGTCDPATGVCSNPPQPDGHACNDGTACTQTDTCQLGTCVGSNPPNCDDANLCTSDSCDPALGCVHAPVPCNVRTGHVQAEKFDSQSGGMNVTLSTVTANVAGGWIAFDYVDFGATGQFGRFQAILAAAQQEQHIQLRLDSPTGTLVADLLTLFSDTSNPAPQSTKFLVPVTGIHKAVIVFGSPSAGSLDWFSLEKGFGTDTVGDFPTDFHHQNPGQGLPDLNNLPMTEEHEEDVLPLKWARPNAPEALAPTACRKVTFDTAQSVAIVAEARWLGSGSEIGVWIVDSGGATIAVGAASSSAGQARSRARGPLQSLEIVKVIICNLSQITLTVDMVASVVKVPS